MTVLRTHGALAVWVTEGTLAGAGVCFASASAHRGSWSGVGSFGGICARVPMSAEFVALSGRVFGIAGMAINRV